MRPAGTGLGGTRPRSRARGGVRARDDPRTRRSGQRRTEQGRGRACSSGLGGPPCTNGARPVQAVDPDRRPAGARTGRRMRAMELDVLITEGLGDASYVLTWGDEAAVVDPQRDVERFVDAADARGAVIRRIVETHVHNDYVSGALELRAATGAEIWGPAEAGYSFGYRPVENGTEIPFGDASLLGVATPGHTPEHLAYLLHDGAEPIALFSGGSLMVGGAGRTDLLGPESTDELTRLQFRSMRRLADLPDEVRVLPTHGAGSFCAVGSQGEQQTSTIGEERATNLSLTETDEEAFVRRQLTGLMAFPDYFADMAPINRAGPPVLGAPPRPRAMTADQVADALVAGARLVDVRDGSAFARRHVAGSLSVPLEPSFASYVGWLLPFATPVVLSIRGCAR